MYQLIFMLVIYIFFRLFHCNSNFVLTFQLLLVTIKSSNSKIFA